MPERPKLSVIVPVYKVEPYLQKCIDSILNQTFRDLELILVDDGSPDNCPAVCDAAAEKDERVVVIHQKNGGLSAARNAGVEAARGEYIGFVDSDDYIAPEMYEKLYTAMVENDAQLAVCSYTYVDPEGNVLPKWKSPILNGGGVLDRVQMMGRLSEDKSWYYITAWNKLYRRELFENIRFPLGKLHEDEYVVHHVFWACERIVVLPQPLYYYVQRGGSIMQQKSLRQAQDWMEGVASRAEFAMEHQLDFLAFSAQKGVVRVLSENWSQKDRTPEEKALLRQDRKKANAVIHKLLKRPGFQSDKIKLCVFLLSPALYHRMMQRKNKLANA